jgi:hypothetical protein
MNRSTMDIDSTMDEHLCIVEIGKEIKAWESWDSPIPQDHLFFYINRSMVDIDPTTDEHLCIVEIGKEIKAWASWVSTITRGCWSSRSIKTWLLILKSDISTQRLSRGHSSHSHINNSFLSSQAGDTCQTIPSFGDIVLWEEASSVD